GTWRRANSGSGSSLFACSRGSRRCRDAHRCQERARRELVQSLWRDSPGRHSPLLDPSPGNHAGCSPAGSPTLTQGRNLRLSSLIGGSPALFKQQPSVWVKAFRVITETRGAKYLSFTDPSGFARAMKLAGEFRKLPYTWTSIRIDYNQFQPTLGINRFRNAL